MQQYLQVSLVNDLRDEGAEVMAQYLATNPALTYLNIRGICHSYSLFLLSKIIDTISVI